MARLLGILIVAAIGLWLIEKVVALAVMVVVNLLPIAIIAAIAWVVFKTKALKP